MLPPNIPRQGGSPGGSYRPRRDNGAGTPKEAPPASASTVDQSRPETNGRDVRPGSFGVSIGGNEPVIVQRNEERVPDVVQGAGGKTPVVLRGNGKRIPVVVTSSGGRRTPVVIQSSSGKIPVVQGSGGRVPVVLQGNGGRVPLVVQGSGGKVPFVIQGSGGRVPVVVLGSGGSFPVINQGRGGRVPVVDQGGAGRVPVVVQGSGGRFPVVIQRSGGRIPVVVQGTSRPGGVPESSERPGRSDSGGGGDRGEEGSAASPRADSGGDRGQTKTKPPLLDRPNDRGAPPVRRKVSADPPVLRRKEGTPTVGQGREPERAKGTASVGAGGRGGDPLVGSGPGRRGGSGGVGRRVQKPAVVARRAESPPVIIRRQVGRIPIYVAESGSRQFPMYVDAGGGRIPVVRAGAGGRSTVVVGNGVGATDTRSTVVIGGGRPVPVGGRVYPFIVTSSRGRSGGYYPSRYVAGTQNGPAPSTGAGTGVDGGLQDGRAKKDGRGGGRQGVTADSGGTPSGGGGGSAPRRPYTGGYPSSLAGIDDQRGRFLAPGGNNTFFEPTDGVQQNVCTDTRVFTRRLPERGQQPPPARSCRSSRAVRLCVTSDLLSDRVKVTETLQRCCPGAEITLDGCKQVQKGRASQQLQRIRSSAFRELLQKAGIKDVLNKTLTMFVPPDRAVDAFLNQTKLGMKSKEMKRILEGHIVDSSTPLAVLALMSPLRSRSGGPVWFSAGTRGPLVNCVRLLSRDRPTPTGGIVHIVRRLIRSSNATLVHTIRTDPELSVFARLMNESGLLEDIADSWGLTILAPNNNAFNDIQLPADIEKKRAILQGHVLGGLQCSGGLPSLARTAAGHVLHLWSPPGGGSRLRLVPLDRPAGVTTVRLMTADRVTGTGLLQVIDRVILPASVRPLLETLKQMDSTAKFALLLERAGMAGELLRSNITIFVPPASALPNGSDAAALRSLAGRHVTRGSVQTLAPAGGALRLPTVSGTSSVLLSGYPSRHTAGTFLLAQCQPLQQWLDLGRRDVTVMTFSGAALKPSGGDLLKLVSADSDLSAFATVLKRSGMEKHLTESGPFTLLAVVNSGLKNAKKIDTRKKARRFIQLHLIKGAVCCSGLSWRGSRHRLYAGGSVLAFRDGGRPAFRPIGGFTSPTVHAHRCDRLGSNGLLQALAAPLAGPDARRHPYRVHGAALPFTFLLPPHYSPHLPILP